jgi:predicted small lipoprotein YifL
MRCAILAWNSLRVWGAFLAFDRPNIGFALALLGLAAFGLAACGRAGPLELPPGPAVGVAPTASAAPQPSLIPAGTLGGPSANGPLSQEAAQKNGFDAYGNPIAPAGEKRSFFLDFLLQ